MVATGKNEVRILLISGSLRSHSTHAAALRSAVAQGGVGVEAVLYGGMGELPHYNPDLDVEPQPSAVAKLRDELASADAVLFSTPEYAGALPGSFKNLLDWAVGCPAMYGKPVAWVNVSSIASPTGAADAHQSLRKVLGYLNARIVEEACVRVPLSHGDVDSSGELKEAGNRARLAGVLVMLRDFCAGSA